jgi:DNA-binding NarL/FixJ family response regulator
MTKIRVLLVDDHALVRLGLMTLINDREDMQVVGEASNPQEALRLIESSRPDVVLMDIRMSGGGGIEATEKITSRYPDAKVIILTSFADDELIMRALRAGAVGYVLKEADNEVLLRAIVDVAHGHAMLDPSVTARLISQMRSLGRKADEDAFHGLTDREISVLAELSRGKTNAEIGQALNLSEKTVRNQVSTILDKLHLVNRVELATYAVEHHIFDSLE